MKSIVFGFVSVGITLVSLAASADPAAPTAAPKPAAMTVHELTVSIRLAKPQVVIVLQRPSAVSAASAAHEQMHERLIAATHPSAH